MLGIGPAIDPGVMPLGGILYLNRHDVSYWGNCPAFRVDWKICDWEQRGSGFKPFPDGELLAVVKCSLGDDLNNHLDVWLAVLSGKRSCQDGSRDEVLKDLLHPELVVWDVVKASYDNNVPRFDLQGLHLSSSAPEDLAGADLW